MKTVKQIVEHRASSVECEKNETHLNSISRPSTFGPRPAFTLVELLIVIAIIGILVGFTIPVLKSVKRTQYISHATAELKQLEAAIESYKTAYGFYPPGNGVAPGFLPGALTNQLYYELEGTTFDGNATYTNLDGSTINAGNFSLYGFNIGGFVNTTKAGGDENSPTAKNFLAGAKPATAMLNIRGQNVTVLVTSVRGPDSTYQPVGQQDINPFRYVYPGVNNPNGYDLWVQLVISGKTNLICNWNTRPQINSPLP